jgi:hypothetical protein
MKQVVIKCKCRLPEECKKKLRDQIKKDLEDDNFVVLDEMFEVFTIDDGNYILDLEHEEDSNV